jgi:hypothetical protein
MNTKTLIDRLSQLDPGAEVVLVMQLSGPHPNGERDLDDEDCEHELACDLQPEGSDIIVAKIDGHPAWLVIRPDGE